MEQRPNIYFICVHKGASTFVARDLFPSLVRRSPNFQIYHVGRECVDWFHINGKRLGLEPTFDRDETTRRLKMMFVEKPLPRYNGLIGRLYPNQIQAIADHLHDQFPPKNSRVFLMRRDPRDALVSMYYSKAFSHSEKGMLMSVNQNTLSTHRNKMQKMGIYAWLEKILSNPTNREIVDEFSDCANIIDTNPQIKDLPYEMLVTNPRLWLDSFVEHADLQSIVDDKWYKEMEQHLVPPKTVDHMQHKRRVTPGNWKEVFDDKLRDLLNHQIGDKMQQLQYHWDK